MQPIRQIRNGSELGASEITSLIKSTPLLLYNHTELRVWSVFFGVTLFLGGLLAVYLNLKPTAEDPLSLLIVGGLTLVIGLFVTFKSVAYLKYKNLGITVSRAGIISQNKHFYSWDNIEFGLSASGRAFYLKLGKSWVCGKDERHVHGDTVKELGKIKKTVLLEVFENLKSSTPPRKKGFIGIEREALNFAYRAPTVSPHGCNFAVLYRYRDTNPSSFQLIWAVK